MINFYFFFSVYDKECKKENYICFSLYWHWTLRTRTGTIQWPNFFFHFYTKLDILCINVV